MVVLDSHAFDSSADIQLPLPEVRASPASKPTAVLLRPVLSRRAALPNALLPEPLASLLSAKLPNALLELPVW